MDTSHFCEQNLRCLHWCQIYDKLDTLLTKVVTCKKWRGNVSYGGNSEHSGLAVLINANETLTTTLLDRVARTTLSSNVNTNGMVYSNNSIYSIGYK